MESKWRQNVYELIGSNYTHWTYGGAFDHGLTHLCARINTPVLWHGKLWTHLLKHTAFGGGTAAFFARIHDTENVLDEIDRWALWLTNFPYGLAVEPDHP